MRKLIVTIIMLSVFIMLWPAAGITHTEEDPLVTPLIAGGGNKQVAQAVTGR